MFIILGLLTQSRKNRIESTRSNEEYFLHMLSYSAGMGRR